MHLGILASHPIQYQAPWFRALAKGVDLEVFFAHRQSAAEQGKAGFGVAFDWDVDLLSGYQHHFLKNISKNPGVNHASGCDTPEISGIISRNAEQGTLNAERFDAFIVMGWYLKSYMQAVKACRAAGVPVLVRGDSQLRTPRPLLKRLLMEVRQRRLLKQFDGFLTVGKRHREYLEHFGVPPEKIFFAPHFIDNEWFAGRAEIARKQRAEIRRQWRIPEDAFCALFCGKFIPKKRPMDLVETARLLSSPPSALRPPPSEFPNLHLLFVGSGELGPQLRGSCNVVFDAENHNSVLPAPRCPLPPASFIGFKNQTELPACYVAADVLVLPSESETWGLTVNEAMACGLPAIVSNAVGCAPDLIEDGKTGFTFPTGDCLVLEDRLWKIGEMRQSGNNFAPALTEKLRAHSVDAAVAGTLGALNRVTKFGQTIGAQQGQPAIAIGSAPRRN